MKAYIDEHRGAYGVEPICKVMQSAPSKYWLHAQRKAKPELRPERAHREDVRAGEVERVWQENLQVYAVRKVWRQLGREDSEAGCPVGRLMRRSGLRGAVRGKRVITTMPDVAAARPDDKVKGVFCVWHRPAAKYLEGWGRFALYTAQYRRRAGCNAPVAATGVCRLRTLASGHAEKPRCARGGPPRPLDGATRTRT